MLRVGIVYSGGEALARVWLGDVVVSSSKSVFIDRWEQRGGGEWGREWSGNVCVSPWGNKTNGVSLVAAT